MNNAQLINQTSGDVEWYTPPAIIEAARATMGSIDLDPASCKIANRTVKAERYYTIADNGLALPWFGNVWINHPFGKEERPCKAPCKKEICKKRGYCISEYKPGNADWISKIISEYRSMRTYRACCITFACTSEAWFQQLFDYPQCYLSPRTNYLGPDGLPVKGVTKGSVVTYLGNDVGGFCREFADMGRIMLPWNRWGLR